jgi:hypothetical protein
MKTVRDRKDRKPTSRAQYAVAGFGTLGIGAIVLSLVLGWQFAVGWVLLVVAIAIFHISQWRRADQSKSPDASVSESSEDAGFERGV